MSEEKGVDPARQATEKTDEASVPERSASVIAGEYYDYISAKLGELWDEVSNLPIREWATTAKERLISMMDSILLPQLTDNRLSPDEKITFVISACTEASIAVVDHRVPLVDMPVLTALHGYMAQKIGDVRGVPDGKGSTLEFLGPVWSDILALQGKLIGGKFLPFLPTPKETGAELSGGIGYALDVYFAAKSQGGTADDNDLQSAFVTGRNAGLEVLAACERRERERRKPVAMPRPTTSTCPTAASNINDVSITSAPEAAEIEIDGVYYGDTPANVPLEAGEHSIRIFKKGYSPWVRKTRMMNRPLRIHAELEKAEAKASTA